MNSHSLAYSGQFGNFPEYKFIHSVSLSYSYLFFPLEKPTLGFRTISRLIGGTRDITGQIWSWGKTPNLGFYITNELFVQMNFSYSAIQSSMSLSGQCRPSSEAHFRCFDDVLALLIIIAGSRNCKYLQREKERGDFWSNFLIVARMASLQLDLKSNSILGVTALLLQKLFSFSANVNLWKFKSLTQIVKPWDHLSCWTGLVKNIFRQSIMKVQVIVLDSLDLLQPHPLHG